MKAIVVIRLFVRISVFPCLWVRWVRWSFRKTVTVGTLASQAKIGGCTVQSPGRPALGLSPCWGRFGRGPALPLRRSKGITSGKFLRMYYMENPAIQCIFGWKMVRNAVHNALHLYNENVVPMLSGSFLDKWERWELKNKPSTSTLCRAS